MLRKNLIHTAVIALLISFIILSAGCLGFASSTGGGSGGNAAVTVSLQETALLSDVTYTFYPRPQGMKAGLDVNSWLEKAVVRGKFLNLYFTDQPNGKGSGSPGAGNFHHRLTIQDLDNPSRTYEAVGRHEDKGIGAFIVSFENVPARRFSFTNEAYGTIELVFEEIVLGTPDQDLGLTTLMDGTYTFFPRPRAMRDGQDVDYYLNKIVVRSGYTNLYLVDRPNGRGTNGWGGGNLHHWKSIQDLDHPQFTYNSVGQVVEDNESGGHIITFENVTARRINFINRAYGSTLLVFEEIVIGEPDEGTSNGVNSVITVVGTHTGSNTSSASIGGTRTAAERPSNGTYTFFPRLRGMKNGLYVNSYIDKVVVSGNTTNVYFTDESIGKGSGGPGAGNFHHRLTLQNLDRPSVTYEAASRKEDSEVGAYIVSFENVAANRLGFVNEAYGEIGVYFEEIILGQPDPPLNFSAIRNGTYTFYPRPRAMKNGLDVNVYLDKIVVRSGFMNVFLVDRTDGRGSGGLGAGNLHHWKLIHDLDHPHMAWNAPRGYNEDRDSGAIVLSFENVTASRFSITNIAYGEIGFVFEEIYLNNAMYE